MSYRMTACIDDCVTVVCNGCGTSLQGGSHYSPSEEDHDLQRLGWSVDSDGHSCPACIAESGATS